LPPLNVCLQVNVSGEASKSGVAPADVPALALAVARLPGLRLRGLMSIPEPADGLEAQRRPHALLRQLLQDTNQALAAASPSALADPLVPAGSPACAAPCAALDTLSMGMSADLEAAVLEGATWVRVGTAIFGARAPHREERTP
jgi:uncharacterized pyridoxal phosphate-containing UPF0001 family protein